MVVKRKSILALSLWAAMGAGGCATFQDLHYEHTQKFHTECAYWHYRWCSDESITSDYGCGWKAGYYDVLTGGDGTPPIVSPKKYWSPGQITKHLDMKRQDWYLGFQDGALMASLEPDTHFVKVWGSPATDPAGYYENQIMEIEAGLEPAAVPPATGSDIPSIPSAQQGWETAPHALPKSSYPPVPAQPEQWKGDVTKP